MGRLPWFDPGPANDRTRSSHGGFTPKRPTKMVNACISALHSSDWRRWLVLWCMPFGRSENGDAIAVCPPSRARILSARRRARSDPSSRCEVYARR
jgi:hypothetical protein